MKKPFGVLNRVGRGVGGTVVTRGDKLKLKKKIDEHAN